MDERVVAVDGDGTESSFRSLFSSTHIFQSFFFIVYAVADYNRILGAKSIGCYHESNISLKK